VTAPAAGRDDDLLSRPVLELDGERVTYAELTVVATLVGEWRTFLDSVTRGRWLARTECADDDKLRRAAEQFRRGRHLEAGSDLRAWLDDRALTLDDWRSALERTVLVAGSTSATVPDPAPIPTAELRASAYCSGVFARWSQIALDWLVASRDRPVVIKRGGPVTSTAARFVDQRRVDTIAAWQQAYDALAAALVDDAAVRRMVLQHELDWTSFDIDELIVASRSAAREAILCARDDGLTADMIAGRSGGRLARRRAYGDALDAELVAALRSASIGTVAGFENRAEGAAVIWLRRRERPSAQSPHIRARAADVILRAELDRRSAGCVRWLGPT
jgi:hypothetical protein